MMTCLSLMLNLPSDMLPSLMFPVEADVEAVLYEDARMKSMLMPSGTGCMDLERSVHPE